MKKSKETIIAIDDNREFLHLLDRVLGDKFNIHTLQDANKVLDLIDSIKEVPDLILLDLVMPGSDGFQILKSIKQNRKFKKIPVVFMSGHAKQEDIIRGYKYGAHDFIEKGFNPGDLLININRLLKIEKS